MTFINAEKHSLSHLLMALLHIKNSKNKKWWYHFCSIAPKCRLVCIMSHLQPCESVASNGTCVTSHHIMSEMKWIECIYHLTKVQYLSHLRVTVHHRFVLDLPGSVGVPEGPQSLRRVAVCWTDARYHQCVTVTSQRVCQHHTPNTSDGPILNL